MSLYAVVDASAAVHIIGRQAGSDRFLETLADTSISLAPDLYTAEVANALWQLVRQGYLSREEATRRWAEAKRLVALVPSDSLAEEALQAAVTFQHPVYDMLYAVLARRHGAQVLTKDRKLMTVLGEMKVEVVTA